MTTILEPARTLASPAPAGPRGLPFAGSLFAIRRDPLRFLSESAKRYGDVVPFRVGRAGRAFFFRHPDHVKDVLVTHQHAFMKGRGLQWAKRFLGEGLLTSEGEVHTRQRRLAQPAFHKNRIQAYGSVMTGYAERMAAGWREGLAFDVSHEMMTLTMGVVGRTLFDADVEGEADEIGRSLSAIVELFPRFNHPLAGVLHKLPLPSNYRFVRARDRLDVTIYRMIEDRRRANVDRGDLLSMLLLARDEDGQGGMTDLELRDQVMTLFLAGHETTSNALTWTFYCLSQNPEAEARVHAELRAVLAGRCPSVDDLPVLRLTEAALAESMRLFPPAWGIGRKALRDQEVGGVLVPKDAYVVVSPYVTHRDARFFPDPERFDLDRWTPEARAARPRFAYFPFGGGARQCIGESFAWMEGVLVLATIARKWRLHLAPGHRVEPQPLITLRARNGMRMIGERRE